MTISVVIPVYNERATIETLLCRVQAVDLQRAHDIEMTWEGKLLRDLACPTVCNAVG